MPPPRPRILIADDQLGPRESLRLVLDSLYDVVTVDSGDAALQQIAAQPFDLLLLDVMMPGKDGLTVLRELRQIQPFMPVIIISALDQAKIAVEAMKLGATTYEVKPFDKDKIRSDVKMAIENYQLKNKLSRLQLEVQTNYQFSNIIGASNPIQKVFHLIQRVAETDSTVLIRGESGTGKELVAREIHYNSPRRDKPFIALDCGAIAKELIESELFGHEKGAFTGALAARAGLFEAASGGTLFLDEIGEMETSLQSRLLRVLQEHQIRRVGANKSVDVDVRLVCATSRNLEKEIAALRFREDLFYRINVVPVLLPALRERPEDIPLLILHFSKTICAKLGRSVPHFSPEAAQLMATYRWPGNVRELRNCIERVLVLNDGHNEITADDLPPQIKSPPPTPAPSDDSTTAPTLQRSDAPPPSAPPSVDTANAPTLQRSDASSVPPAPSAPVPVKTLDERIIDLERQSIADALKQSEGHITRAAASLGISRRILKYKMDKLGFATEDDEPAETDSTPVSAPPP